MSPQQNPSQSSMFRALVLPVAAITVLILIAAVLVMSLSDSEQNAPQPGGGPTTVSNRVMNVLRSKYDKLAESQGNPNAPVTVREFGDYQCPACGAFEPTAERLRSQFVDTGKVRFLFYDFPLAIHQHAQAAAIAARCAADQGGFWPYHNRLYATQSKWSDEKDPTSTFLDIAVETGLNPDKLKTCLTNKTPLPTINAERDAGRAIALRATPTVMVGDTLFVGGTSFGNLKAAINSKLPPGDKLSGTDENPSGNNSAQ